MEQIKKLRSIKTKKQVVICYARTGHRIWSGLKQDIPEELKNYYVFLKINNNRYTYLEIVEDEEWFK